MSKEQRRLVEAGHALGEGPFALPVARKRRLPGDQLNPSPVPLGKSHQAEIPDVDLEVRDRGDRMLSESEVAPAVVPLGDLLSILYPVGLPDCDASSTASSTQLNSSCCSESDDHLYSPAQEDQSQDEECAFVQLRHAGGKGPPVRGGSPAEGRAHDCTRERGGDCVSDAYHLQLRLERQHVSDGERLQQRTLLPSQVS